MSSEYQTLKDAISDLKSGLMSFEPRNDGDYTPEELLKCKAFIVFAHAEIENYLEKIARRIMSEAQQRWEEAFVPDRVIATLLAFRRKESAPLSEELNQSSGKSNLQKIVKDCFKLQTKVIDDNNGVKSSNLSRLFCPLGILPQDIEEQILIDLDNIGKRRGGFVHQKSKVSMRQIRDPFAVELSDIDNLVNNLGKFDKDIENTGLLSVPTPTVPSA